MDQIWPILTAVLAANLLTASFLWGMHRASKIYDIADMDRTTALAFLLPAFFLGFGFYLYG